MFATMLRMFKKLFVVFLFLFLVPSFKFQVFATEEFGTSYDVIYDVGEDGVTTVTEKVTLKNLTSQFYASQFKLIIGATQITDIKASDDGGSLKISSDTKDGKTAIDVKFNQQVAGINKSLAWTLSFKSKDFAEKLGKVWEIRAPKVAVAKNLQNYNLTIAVPSSFGDPSLISPTPKTQTVSNGKLFLTFSKDQLLESGVSANFGQMQLYDFDLTYHLQNNNIVPVLTNIALPPDSAYQDVIFSRIEPKPFNVTQDMDGNYLAWYRLSRGQRLDINVVGSSKIYATSKAKNPYLSDDLKKKYLSAQKYWEKDNPAILSKLTEILGPNPLKNEEKIKLIYSYVVNNLKYDSTRLNTDTDRLGAVTVLNNPTTAVCMEFTDLFIALSRAAGIPTRELDGFAYSTNQTLRPLSLSKDTLHAWPEYWSDSRGWVMVDPTWEETSGGVDYFNKLDLNHFVFAIKGLSPLYPSPAGTYKGFKEDTNDVKVNLTDKDFLGKAQLDVAIDTPNPSLSGFPAKLKIRIRNLGNAVFPSSSLGITASRINILDSGQNSGNIPSFGTAEFDINYRTHLFDSFDDQVTLLIGSQKFIKDIKIASILSLSFLPFLLGGIIFIMVFIYLVILSSHVYISRKPKKKK